MASLEPTLKTLKRLRERIEGLSKVMDSLQDTWTTDHPDFELVSLGEFKNRFRENLQFLRFLYTRGSSLYPWTFQGIFLSRVEAQNAEENLIYEDEFDYEFRRAPVSGGLREVHCLNGVLEGTGFAVESFCEAFLPTPDPGAISIPQKAVLLRVSWKGNLSGFPRFSADQARADAARAKAKGLPSPSSSCEVWSSKGLYGGGWRLRRLFLTPEDVYRSIFDGLAGWSSCLNPQRLDDESYTLARNVVSLFLEQVPAKAYATRFSDDLMRGFVPPEFLHVLQDAAYWSSVLRIWAVKRHWSEPEATGWETDPHIFPPALKQYRTIVELLSRATAGDTARLIASFLVAPFFPSWRRCWAFSEAGLRCTSPLPFSVEGDVFCNLHDFEGEDWMDKGQKY